MHCSAVRVHTIHAVNSCTLRKFRCQTFKFHFAFLTFSCTDDQHRTGTPAHGGLGQKQVHPLCVRISILPGKRVRAGRPIAVAYRFCPGRIKQGISALMLRHTHSRQLHAGASFAEMAARSFTGLERKGGRCCTAPFRYAGRLIS